MKLSTFLTGLIEEGKVVIEGKIHAFPPEDIAATTVLLRRYYTEDTLDMPQNMPAFSEEAALWATQFLYNAMQFTVLRNLDDDAVQAHLKDYLHPTTPEAAYSVDLVFRYLPDVYKLAKGLSPDDILVKILQKNALRWNFSSVGIALNEAIEQDWVLKHPALRTAYIDRIIKNKDSKRLSNDLVREYVQAALGDYTPVFWAELNLQK